MTQVYMINQLLVLHNMSIYIICNFKWAKMLKPLKHYMRLKSM